VVRLRVRPLTSPPIGEALSDDALQRDRRALAISEAECSAISCSGNRIRRDNASGEFARRGDRRHRYRA
jgi:hypothetical protein